MRTYIYLQVNALLCRPPPVSDRISPVPRILGKHGKDEVPNERPRWSRVSLSEYALPKCTMKETEETIDADGL